MKTTTTNEKTGNGKQSTAIATKVDKPIVELKGKEYTQNFLTANHFMEYERRKTSQSVKLANEWLVYEAYGHDLDLSSIRFRDRGKLLTNLTYADITYNDDLPLDETADFTVEGNRFTETENSGDAFDQFVALAQKNPTGAYRNATKRTLMINGEPITDSHFELIAPSGAIGFKGMAVVHRWLSAFLS